MTDKRLAPSWFRPVIQFVGFLRKEFLAIIRQPRLLLILVVGPFLVLALFAVGFDQKETVLDTKFVGPEDGIYESSLEEFADEFDQYLNYNGYTADVVAAEQELEDGDVDLIVIFPSDPVEDILSGEQATINVLHDKIDPIQKTTVEVSAQVAVQELNARLLEQIVGAGQNLLVPFEDSLQRSVSLIEDLSVALEADDEERIAEITTELTQSSSALSTIVEVSDEVASELNADSEGTYSELAASTSEFERLVADAANGVEISESDLDSIESALAQVSETGELATTLDPRVIVRPFAGETANLQRQSVAVEDYFAPGAVALLVQHMVLTFAAMSLVTDRAAGLFELFRVGPVGAGRIMLGKVVAFALVGGGAAAVLFAALRFALDMPMRGSLLWVAIATCLLLVASIGLGLCISLISKTDTQAVQYALLALLAGLFFGGFFLDLDAFRYPVKALSWMMPVTYGTRIYRDVLLRGSDPATIDIVGLVAVGVAFIGLSWFFLARRIRVE